MAKKIVLINGPDLFPNLEPTRAAAVAAEFAAAGVELRLDWLGQDEATQAEWLREAAALTGAPL